MSVFYVYIVTEMLVSVLNVCGEEDEPDDAGPVVTIFLLVSSLLPTPTMSVSVGRIFESVCLSVCLSAA